MPGSTSNNVYIFVETDYYLCGFNPCRRVYYYTLSHALKFILPFW